MNSDQVKLSKILCIQCGERGFKRIQSTHNSMSVQMLECVHCSAHIYDHATMQAIQAHDEQSATKEYFI